MVQSPTYKVKDVKMTHGKEFKMADSKPKSNTTSLNLQKRDKNMSMSFKQSSAKHGQYPPDQY